MSSTNRCAIRREADFYATPEAAFKPLLELIHFNGSSLCVNDSRKHFTFRWSYLPPAYRCGYSMNCFQNI